MSICVWQVQQEAAAYWWLRAGLAPIALLNMAINGILQARISFRPVYAIEDSK